MLCAQLPPKRTLFDISWIAKKKTPITTRRSLTAGNAKMNGMKQKTADLFFENIANRQLEKSK